MGLDSVDIILGTDWLYHVVIDVAARAIEIHSPLDGEITLYLPDQGCTRSCAFSMIESDRKSTRLNSSHSGESRMPSSA